MTQEKDNDSWDDYISGNFLKAINVDSENDGFVVVQIENVTEKEIKKIRLNLERNGKEFDFDLNKTNASKLKELGIATPREVIGKVIFFKKALVRNPTTNKEVDGLRIYKIA